MSTMSRDWQPETPGLGCAGGRGPRKSSCGTSAVLSSICSSAICLLLRICSAVRRECVCQCGCAGGSHLLRADMQRTMCRCARGHDTSDHCTELPATSAMKHAERQRTAL